MYGSSLSSFEISEAIQLRISKYKDTRASRNKRDKSSSPCITPSDDKLPVGARFLSQKYFHLLTYLVIIHFFDLPEKTKVYCILDLQEHLTKNDQSYWLIALLFSKDNFCRWLEETETIHFRTFFGNIINEDNLDKCIDEIIMSFEESFHRPRKPIRRRGYKDKGNLPSLFQKAFKSSILEDINLKSIQFRKEEKRNSHQEDILLLDEYLRSEDGFLTDAQLRKFRIARK